MAVAIPKTLSDYRGAGYALAACGPDGITALRYLEDLAPELGDALEDGGQTAKRAALRWCMSDAAGPAVKELSRHGTVSVGMCSCGEFIYL